MRLVFKLLGDNYVLIFEKNLLPTENTLFDSTDVVLLSSMLLQVHSTVVPDAYFSHWFSRKNYTLDVM